MKSPGYEILRAKCLFSVSVIGAVCALLITIIYYIHSQFHVGCLPQNAIIHSRHATSLESLTVTAVDGRHPFKLRVRSQQPSRRSIMPLGCPRNLGWPHSCGFPQESQDKHCLQHTYNHKRVEVGTESLRCGSLCRSTRASAPSMLGSVSSRKVAQPPGVLFAKQRFLHRPSALQDLSFESRFM